jgi:hypothetical protein
VEGVAWRCSLETAGLAMGLADFGLAIGWSGIAMGCSGLDKAGHAVAWLLRGLAMGTYELGMTWAGVPVGWGGHGLC